MWGKLSNSGKIVVVAVILIIAGIVAYNYGGKPYLKKIADKIAPSSKAKTSDATSADDDNVLQVGVNTWWGFAGMAFANGGFEPNKESIFYKKYGILVRLVHIDAFDDSRAAWKSDKIGVCWGTLDALPTEVDGLKEIAPKAFINIDWSRGGDVIVAERGINSMADLKGKKVAFALKTPSHTMLLMALKAANMTQSDITVVDMGDAIKAADAFKAGQVAACVTWAPNDQECLKAVNGSHVLISTKTLSNAIADVLYAKQSFIDKHKDLLQKFVDGVMEGNAALNSDPANLDAAKKYLAAGFGMSLGFFDSTANKARLCTVADNVNFFGLNATFSGVTGEDLYSKMCREFSSVGAAPTTLPSARDVLDPEFIQAIPSSLSGLPNQIAESDVKFTPPTVVEEKVEAVANKKVTINFASGSADLSPEAQTTIDKQCADIAKTFKNARIRIEGNTDNTGSNTINIPLSKRRAQAVAKYLAENYNFPKNRFVVVGNGSKKPVAPNTTEDGKASNRRTDFEILSND